MKTTVKTFIFLLISSMGFAQELSNDMWLDDLATYQKGLEEKHIDLYNTISSLEFNAELAKIKNSLASKTDLETTLDLMRLTRKIGDGHTAISVRNLDFHIYPFEVQNFDGDWRVVKVVDAHRNLLGQKLVGIENEDINSVVQKVGEAAQFVENEHSLVVRTGENLTSSELLYGLKISKEKTKSRFTFITDSGEKSRINLSALTRQEFADSISLSELSIGVPEIVPPKNSEVENFWYTPISGTKALYIHFESYPNFEAMMKIAEEMMGYISQNNIQQLVIDLRNNGGGDLYIGLVLANALNLADSVNWKSGVYVLCDKVTFSAATSNTALFRELLNATIVGEPTGSNPTGYQDMDTFELPNSKLVVCYSKRLFRIQENATPGVQPDVSLKYEWEDYSQGKDNMLEWVVDKISEK